MDLIESSRPPARRHPWEQARFAFFLRVLQRYTDLETIETILDVGSGDAWFAEQLTRHTARTRILCWDTGYTPEILASDRLPRPGRLEFSATKPGDRFPLIILLDVLEHVERDRDFLGDIVRDNMTLDGHVLISVPAWPLLFSSHDARLLHYRRYTPASARRLIESAGLDIIRSAGLFQSLAIARLAQVARERLVGPPPDRGGIGEWQGSASVTALVRALLVCDSLVSIVSSDRHLSLPGLSWWALCSRHRRSL